MRTTNTTKPTARKLSGKAVKPAAKAATKPVKPVAPAAVPAAAADRMHGYGTSYTGASPAIRMHGRKLSPIVLDRVPNAYTDRDAALLKALHQHNKLAAFQRRDIDAGALSRLIGHGYVRHVSGGLDERTATFAITDAAIKARFATVSAKPAKA